MIKFINTLYESIINLFIRKLYRYSSIICNIYYFLGGKKIKLLNNYVAMSEQCYYLQKNKAP